MADVMRI